jgi:hypothetical protein
MSNPFLVWLTAPNPAGLLLYSITLALCCAVFCASVPARTSEPVDDADDSVASSGLSERGGPLALAVEFMIGRQPGHPKAGDPQYATRIAKAMVTAGEQYGIDPWLLVAMGHWESRFRPDVLSLKTVGPAGEKGVLQCGKQCARACDHFMDTVEGQALCGANWLRVSIDSCRGQSKRHSAEFMGLVMYSSGTQCAPVHGEGHGAKAKMRTKLRNRLKNMFASGTP